MRIITQISLFDDTLNENLGDLERLQKVLANLPDEELIQKLKTVRGSGTETSMPFYALLRMFAEAGAAPAWETSVIFCVKKGTAKLIPRRFFLTFL